MNWLGNLFGEKDKVSIINIPLKEGCNTFCWYCEIRPALRYKITFKLGNFTRYTNGEKLSSSSTFKEFEIQSCDQCYNRIIKSINFKYLQKNVKNVLNDFLRPEMYTDTIMARNMKYAPVLGKLKEESTILYLIAHGLEDLNNNCNAKNRNVIGQALTDIGGNLSINLLLDIAFNDKYNCREAINLLGYMRDKRSIEPMTELLIRVKSKDYEKERIGTLIREISKTIDLIKGVGLNPDGYCSSCGGHMKIGKKHDYDVLTYSAYSECTKCGFKEQIMIRK